MKKQTSYSIQPLLLTLMLTILPAIYSCNFEVFKKGPVEKAPPAGHILEYGTNAPIPNALVYIQECESESLGNISCQQIDTVFSDADGYYQFPVSGFRVNAQKNGFFSDDNSFTYVDVGNETTTDVVLSPHAWLEVTLKNESGAYLIGAPGENGDSNSRDFYLNQNQDTTFIIFGGGNKDLKYGFDILDTPNHVLDDFSNVKVNGGAIPIIKEGIALIFKVYLIGHDTVHITITY